MLNFRTIRQMAAAGKSSGLLTSTTMQQKNHSITLAEIRLHGMMTSHLLVMVIKFVSPS